MDIMEQELWRLAVKVYRLIQEPTSHVSALTAIMEFRSDINSEELTDDQWGSVQVAKEAQGHVRESYEKKKRNLWFANPSEGAFSSTEFGGANFYLYKLKEPIPNLEVLRREDGVKDEHEGRFARINLAAKSAIEHLLQQQFTLQAPTFIPLVQAAKDLSEMTCYPILGIDSVWG
ncbi:MAG: hypothetical protein Q9209_006314 [Squamulea sp. 1 TL-2023]